MSFQHSNTNNPFSMFSLQHPAILENRRRKFVPPVVEVPSVIMPVAEQPPPKKIKQTIRKKNKDIKVEIVEPPQEEQIINVSKKKTRTIKPKISMDMPVPTDEIEMATLNMNKKISTLQLADDNEQTTTPL